MTINVSDVNEAQGVTEPYQKVYTSSNEISFTPGKDVSLDLLYTTSDNQKALAWLTLNVHYNSKVLDPTGGKDGVSY